MATGKHIEKLPNAPLQEVIFELLWEMNYDNSGYPVDLDFEFAQGIFAQKIEKEFPVRKRTLPEGAPLRIYPKPIHQFWKGENIWPVIQIGPGILTVNDVEQNYIWKEYKKLITKAVKILTEAYNKELKYIKIGLKYIDAVEIGDRDYLSFINDHFDINFTNNFDHTGEIINIKINETFSIENVGNLDILISSGVSKNNKHAVIWQSNISNNEKLTGQNIITWLESAHQIVSDHFKKIVKDSFYASFTKPK